MKIFMLIIYFIVGSIVLYATPPNLEMEKLFDGRFNANKKIETTIYKNNGMYYRGFTIKGDPKVIAEITKTIEKDKDKASKYTFHQDKDGSYTSLQFLNNGYTIFTGLQIEDQGIGFFYIQAKEKAFE